MYMKDYKPQYRILRPSDMAPRNKIALVPEEKLDPLTSAELSNLRAGIQYKFTIGDTPSNRENFNFKALYFQLVAYKEGWRFNPDNLQVVYLPPGDPRLGPDGYQSRIFEVKKVADDNKTPVDNEVQVEGLVLEISPGNRLGFRLNERTGFAKQMKPHETDDLGEVVAKLFY